jgi:hypothetical protein
VSFLLVPAAFGVLAFLAGFGASAGFEASIPSVFGAALAEAWKPNCRSDVGSTPESRIDPCSFRSTIVAGAGSSPCFTQPSRFGIHDRTRAGLVTAPRADSTSPSKLLVVLKSQDSPM